MNITDTFSSPTGVFTPTMKTAPRGFSDSLSTALAGERVGVEVSCQDHADVVGRWYTVGLGEGVVPVDHGLAQQAERASAGGHGGHSLEVGGHQQSIHGRWQPLARHFQQR